LKPKPSSLAILFLFFPLFFLFWLEGHKTVFELMARGIMLIAVVGFWSVGRGYSFLHGQYVPSRSVLSYVRPLALAGVKSSAGLLQALRPGARRQSRPLPAAAVQMIGWGFLPPPKPPPEPEPTIVEVSNESEFESMLASGLYTNKLVVVDWYASWCKVCFFLEPRFKKLAREFMDKAIFIKIDAIVLEFNDGKAGPSKLKGKCGVSKYPTFQVWKDGTLVGEIIGVMHTRIYVHSNIAPKV